MRHLLLTGVAAGLGLFAAACDAREQLHIVGSSTVYPFATAVAEAFAEDGSFKTPIVESTGTGGGIKLFCAGSGEATPDIANASRKIKESEIADCRKNGVDGIVEVEIGFDGIVVANAKSHDRYALTPRELWLALAREVPVDGKLVANPYRSWAEINPAFPAEKIEVLGPPPTSGTRDAFVELVMDKGCKGIAEIEALEEKAKKAACGAIREDGAYIDAGENDNLIVQKLAANPAALGIFGYSFLEQNADRLQGSLIDGVEPSFEAIAGGQYEVSRPLYLYVKSQHAETVPGLREFLAEFVSDKASGADGYLADKGLIPLPADRHEKAAAAALTLTPLF